MKYYTKLVSLTNIPEDDTESKYYHQKLGWVYLGYHSISGDGWDCKKALEDEEDEEYSFKEEDLLYKMFLCTKEGIKVGDKIKSTLHNEKLLLVDRIERNDLHTIYYDKRNIWFCELDAYKIIGEIVQDIKNSIQENQEYTEEQFKETQLSFNNEFGVPGIKIIQ